MNLQEAIQLIHRNAPCMHESVDTSLGNGEHWVHCDDCGETLDKYRMERLRKCAKSYYEALGVIEDAIKVQETKDSKTDYVRWSDVRKIIAAMEE